MHILNRYAAAMLAAAVLTGLFCSCSNNSEEDDALAGAPSSLSAETKEQEPPEFISADYKGAEFVICSPMDSSSEYGDNYIDNEDFNGEAVNDAVVSRNLAVEEKYNVRIVKRTEGARYALQAFRSGTVDFDIVYDSGLRLVPGVMEGVYTDLDKLGCLSLNRDYWASSAYDSLTVADSLYIAACDISMSRIDYADLYVFNKGLLEQFNLPCPYDYVEANGWTFDRLIELFSSVRQDIDGDGLWSAADIYGIDSFTTEDAAKGAGICKNLTVKNVDGRRTLNVYSEKLVELYNRYSSTTRDPSAAPAYIDWAAGRDVSGFASIHRARKVISFGEGHAVFQRTTMASLKDIIGGDYDISFGIAPMPKYDATQKEYCHETDAHAPMFAVAKDSADLKRTGTVLEYLAYESMQKLYPAYLKQTIGSEKMSDPDGRDEKMLEIIRSSVYYRTTALYYPAIFDQVGRPWDPCSKMLAEMLSSGDFSALQKKYKDKAEKSIASFEKSISEIEAK